VVIWHHGICDNIHEKHLIQPEYLFLYEWPAMIIGLAENNLQSIGMLHGQID